MTQERNYWVVGAMFGGSDDRLDSFIASGRWSLGWERTEQPEQQARFDRIRVGDRIAVKRMLGRGAPDIEIRALGIVTELAPADRSVGVRWAVADLDRRVPAHGCLASIHGPFPADDDWTRQAFQL